MTTRTLSPLLITTLLAVLLVVGFNVAGRPATEAATDGAAMSLRVDASQTIECAGGPVAGTVCVPVSATFEVIVVADAIPPTGYIRVQAWVDYDDQGLAHNPKPTNLWPDLESATFLTIDDVSNNGMQAAGFTSVIGPAPPSFHKGDLFSFSLTCSNAETSSELRILTLESPADSNGADFIEFSSEANKILPSVTGLSVNCIPKQPDPGDTDGDGCSDERENGPNETLGGQRDWLNPWDFYDVAGSPNPPQNGAPDGVIDLPNDVLGVLQHFAPLGTEPEYDIAFDRGHRDGKTLWSMTAPDGVIDLPIDILGVIYQFGHRCQ